MANDVAIAYDQVPPPVAVEVEEARTEADITLPNAIDAGRRCVEAELFAVLQVLQQGVHFVFVVGHEHGCQTAAVEITDVDPHATLGDAASIDSGPGLHGRFFQPPVTAIEIKKSGHSVVGDEDVGASIAVEVCDDDAQAFAGIALLVTA